VPAWLDAIGEFEAIASLATYAFERPDDVYPAIVEGPALFEGEDLGHPLLPAAGCVRNGVSLGGSIRMLMVSGSNMSGKSTLLRTVGVNAVLALCGAPVRARALRIAPMQIGASLHIIDSIQSGTSHFYAEILRLRAILERTRGPFPVLFLIDEILHGTNSHDRRIGSEAVLRGLVDAGAIGLVTTHDLALTAIVDGLGGRAQNVHFVDRLENGRLTFDYRMRPGVVDHSNALALMRNIGLDV
jgi:DNA mismatch repair ATPase MutS